MIETKRYVFKTEFCKELKIPMNQAERKLTELLEWLKNFYDFTFYPGKPNVIEIHEIYGEYQPLPRKVPSQEALTAQKIQDYDAFTFSSLDQEYASNSKTKIARDAIEAFGFEKYHHINANSVARRYISEPLQKYGETDNTSIWVYYSTYQPLDETTLKRWRDIMADEHLNETEASNAFFRYADGEDISQELSYFKTARMRFREEFDDIPVLVKKWRLKADYIN